MPPLSTFRISRGSSASVVTPHMRRYCCGEGVFRICTSIDQMRRYCRMRYTRTILAYSAGTELLFNSNFGHSPCARLSIVCRSFFLIVTGILEIATLRSDENVTFHGAFSNSGNFFSKRFSSLLFNLLICVKMMFNFTRCNTIVL